MKDLGNNARGTVDERNVCSTQSHISVHANAIIIAAKNGSTETC